MLINKINVQKFSFKPVLYYENYQFVTKSWKKRYSLASCIFHKLVDQQG